MGQEMSMNLFNELVKAGLRPRLAVAVSRMVAAGGTRVATSAPAEVITAAVNAAKLALCTNVADNWAKVAKGSTPSPSAPSSGGGGGGGMTLSPNLYSCFPGGTPVATPDGEIPIEALRPGDLITTFDTSSGQRAGDLVVDITGPLPHDGHILFKLADGAELRVTAAHRLLTRIGFSQAGLVRRGDLLVMADRTTSEVVGAELTASSDAVYNLQVEGPRTFIAGGVVVHNATIVRGADGEFLEAAKMADGEEAEVAEDLEALLEKAREEESRDSEEVVKVGYAVARSMGASNEEALCAAMHAFTSMPKASDVDAGILGAVWFQEG
jgi:hypothetical protein